MAGTTDYPYIELIPPSTVTDPFGEIATSGVLLVTGNVSISEIIDGTTNTFMLGEIANPIAGANTSENGGDAASWVRGVGNWAINNVTGISSIKSVKYGINMIGDEFNNFTFSSLHSGSGANFARADGSVTFVSQDVDVQIYKATCSRNESEVETVK
jgi:prepilin-type processing-associated H-X9-DG protein